MSVWGDVRDELRRPRWAGVLGRQVAGRLVEAMRVALAGGGRVFVLGTWPQVFAALGLPQPSPKAARAALGLLSKVTASVVRVTSQTWRVVSHRGDQPAAEQLGFRFAPNRKAESPEGAADGGRARRPRSLRARARAALLERLWGREPACPRARRLARAVEAQREAGRVAVAVTLTSAIPSDYWAELAAKRFQAAVVHGGGDLELVAERSAVGRLHWHGVVLGLTAERVEEIAAGAGVGERAVEELQRPARARYWAGYAWKAPAEGHAVRSSIDYEVKVEPVEPADGVMQRAAGLLRRGWMACRR